MKIKIPNIHNSLAHLTLILLLNSCSTNDFGKLTEVREYRGVNSPFSQGFASIQATAVEVSGSHPPSVELHAQKGDKLIATWNYKLPQIHSLDANKSYRFDLIVTKGKKNFHTKAEVYRISDGDRVIADLSRCSLHDCLMGRSEQEWIDGFEEQQSGKHRTYPNSGIYYQVSSTAGYGVDWVCSLCRDAEHKEIQNHHKKSE